MNDAERLDKAMDDCETPVHMREGLRNYVLHRRRSGDFLMSILENNFAQAVMRTFFTMDGRADTLLNWSWLLHSGGIPNDAWGSKVKVGKWLARTEGQPEPLQDQPVFGAVGGLDILHTIVADAERGHAAGGDWKVPIDRQDAKAIRWAIEELAKTFKDDITEIVSDATLGGAQV